MNKDAIELLTSMYQNHLDTITLIIYIFTGIFGVGTAIVGVMSYLWNKKIDKMNAKYEELKDALPGIEEIIEYAKDSLPKIEKLVSEHSIDLERKHNEIVQTSDTVLKEIKTAQNEYFVVHNIKDSNVTSLIPSDNPSFIKEKVAWELYLEGKYTESLEIYKALTIDYSKEPSPWKGKSMCEMQLNSLQNSLESAMTGLSLLKLKDDINNGNLSQYYNQIAIIYYIIDDLKRATYYFEQSIQTYNNILIFYILIDIYETLDDCKNGIIVLNKLLKIKEDPQYRFKKGICYFKLKEYDKATTDFEHLIDQQGNISEDILKSSRKYLDIMKYEKIKNSM